MDISPSPPAARPLYIADADESIFALFHDARAPERDLAVLLCAPFGWEDMCSYRGRREWACQLASAGYATLRFDFPGSGDSSGGPYDPERLRAWTDATAASARWLSNETGAQRIVAVGIGLGGAIAYRALALGAPIDDLVLWGVSARGRRHVRELRAFSYLETARVEPEPTGTATVEDSDDGSLVVAGYALSAETQRELDELDLAELDGERLQSARVLLLERDGRKVDARLRSALEERGAELTVAVGDGYAGMMMAELPHAVSAYEVFASVGAWLGELSAAQVHSSAEASPSTPGSERDSVEILLPDGKRVRETALMIEHPSGNAIGVLAEPLGSAVDLCAVWLNAGPQRRIGPNRMWVETARRWAARGVPTFRVDLTAIGDADGDSRRLLDVSSYYTEDYLGQVRLVLDTLEARGLPGRFLLGGLCAGGYWALRLAQQESRVRAAAVLNPGYLVYDGGLSNAVGQSRALGPRLFQRATWRRVLRGEVTPSAHLRALRVMLAALAHLIVRLPSRLLSRDAERHDEIAQAFNTLRDQDQLALILFAGEERLYRELLNAGKLAGLERWPNISLEHMEATGDMHTLRSLRLQRAAHLLVDRLLQKELERIASDTSSPPVVAGASQR